MPETRGEDNIREYLMAFADGELDADQSVRVLDYLAEHPEELELLRGQQRLRLFTASAIRTGTPAVPDELRRRIEAMATPPASVAPSRRPLRIDWRLAAVAASFLLIGLLVQKALHSPRPVGSSNEVAQAQSPVPATTIAHATRIHADCSRLPAALHAAGYPRELKGLEGIVATDLGRTSAYPDLSSLSYEFIGAGPCADPLADTAHLLYRSKAAPQHTLSVFVQQFRNQFPLSPATVYDVAGPSSPFPMYAWRTEKVIYFLIADEPGVMKPTQQLILASVK